MHYIVLNITSITDKGGRIHNLTKILGELWLEKYQGYHQIQEQVNNIWRIYPLSWLSSICCFQRCDHSVNQQRHILVEHAISLDIPRQIQLFHKKHMCFSNIVFEYSFVSWLFVLLWFNFIINQLENNINLFLNL